MISADLSYIVVMEGFAKHVENDTRNATESMAKMLRNTANIVMVELIDYMANEGIVFARQQPE